LQGGKEVSSSQGGSREGSENGGENASVEEIDKMQVMPRISLKCWSRDQHKIKYGFCRIFLLTIKNRYQSTDTVPRMYFDTTKINIKKV
jgi:hypothetical protein